MSSPVSPRVERAIDSGDRLGECPIWDERMATLWWIDIMDGR